MGGVRQLRSNVPNNIAFEVAPIEFGTSGGFGSLTTRLRIDVPGHGTGLPPAQTKEL